MEKEPKKELAFAPFSDEELRAMDVPETTWGAFGLVPHPGLVAVSGQPETYKTFFCLHMAARIAQGLPTFDGAEVPVGGNVGPEGKSGEASGVLFIEDENTVNLMKERMSMLSEKPVPGLWFMIQDGFKFMDGVLREKMMAFCAEKGIRTVFMDPFSSVAGLKDENSNSEVAVAMDVLRLEIVKRGVSVVFIHHPSKGEEGGTNLRGAGDILGKVDVHVTLEREDREDTDNKRIIVKFAKMRIADKSRFQHFKMELKGNGFEYLGTLKGEKERSKQSLRSGILVTLLGTELSAADLADRLGTNRNGDAFKASLASLCDDGTVEKSGAGGHTKYRLKPTV